MTFISYVFTFFLSHRFSHLIRFFTLQLFSRCILASACCVRRSRIASCFVYRLLRRFFCSFGFLSFFLLHEFRSPLARRTLRGVHSSEILSLFLCFLHFIFAPLNNSINIVFVLFRCLLFISNNGAIHRKVDISPTKTSPQNYTIQQRIKEKFQKLSPFRYYFLSIQSLIFHSFFLPCHRLLRLIVPNYSIRTE